MNRKRIILILLVCTTTSVFVHAEELSLWFRQAAASWNEALPVGNGRLGAMVF